MQPQITYVEGIDAVLYDDDILIPCTNIGHFPAAQGDKARDVAGGLFCHFVEMISGNELEKLLKDATVIHRRGS